MGVSHSSLQLHVSAFYRPSSGCTTSCYKVKLYNTRRQGACHRWRDLFNMNYILTYNYCNLNRVECHGTDITSISDDVSLPCSRVLYSFSVESSNNDYSVLFWGRANTFRVFSHVFPPKGLMSIASRLPVNAHAIKLQLLSVSGGCLFLSQLEDTPCTYEECDIYV